MEDAPNRILVWLPSPIGDAVLCTPALRAIRERFSSSAITFLGSPTIREILSPCRFCDTWLDRPSNNLVKLAAELRKGRFDLAVLLKNSFASALAVALARIPRRLGYARDGRGFLLTDRLHPPRQADGKHQPVSMIDYYLRIAARLDAPVEDRRMELSFDAQNTERIKVRFGKHLTGEHPVIVLVPGGAFGPSKCWPPGRFAQVADHLIQTRNAAVFVSVAPDPAEAQIATRICNAGEHELVDLAEQSVTLGQLKSLFALADLVIANDTGPRHVAVALGRKVVSLFGPNDPAWTETEYERETKIIGQARCAPCRKPLCRASHHLCMRAITTETVRRAAQNLLENNAGETIAVPPLRTPQAPKPFFVNPRFQPALAKLGLTSVDAAFSFNTGSDLAKPGLAQFRTRLRIDLDDPTTTSYLKRYDHPPLTLQLATWLGRRRRASVAYLEAETAETLSALGIPTPTVVAYGQQWGLLFEKRSFIITEQIPNAQSLERQLPECLRQPPSPDNLRTRRRFIYRLAEFVREFHETGYRHRDLYFSHVFHDKAGRFHLIDLARAFRPRWPARRYQIKDLAQMHYSAPAESFSTTDRVRFILAYLGRRKLTTSDKRFVLRVVAKAASMARHNIKHGRQVPFLAGKACVEAG